jgi:hypothetical protein
MLIKNDVLCAHITDDTHLFTDRLRVVVVITTLQAWKT